MSKLSSMADSVSENMTSEGLKKMRSRKPVVILLLIVIVLLGVWFASGKAALTGGSRWQVVFLASGQTYFGHITRSGDILTLSKVFYLRANEQFQQSTPPTTAFDLVKLGGELHGPEDKMFIPEGAILFWENMRADSQVVLAIENFLKQNK